MQPGSECNERTRLGDTVDSAFFQADKSAIAARVDNTALPPPNHAWGHFATDQYGRHQVPVDQRTDIRPRNEYGIIRIWFSVAGPAGSHGTPYIVDENINVVQLVMYLADHSLDSHFVGNITVNADRWITALLCNLAGYRVQEFRFAGLTSETQTSF